MTEGVFLHVQTVIADAVRACTDGFHPRGEQDWEEVFRETESLLQQLESDGYEIIGPTEVNLLDAIQLELDNRKGLIYGEDNGLAGAIRTILKGRR